MRFDVTIAGELNLDLILYGLPEQLPTERELMGSGFAMTLGSSSAILAHNLAVLGTRVGFVTKVGDDELGRVALERLSESGADLSRVIQAEGCGSGVTVILPHDRDRHIFTYPGTIFELGYDDLDLEYLASARHFHMSSLFLHRAMQDRIPELFRYMKKAGLTTSLDTNDDPDDRWDGVLHETLPYVDVLLPNEREAAKIAGVEDIESALSWLSQRVPAAVVKMGARGAMAVVGNQRFSAAPVAVEVVDPVGAGDSFNAGFLHQYLRGSDIRACMAYANLIGAFSTTACGGTEAFRRPSLLHDFVSKQFSAEQVARQG